MKLQLLKFFDSWNLEKIEVGDTVTFNKHAISKFGIVFFANNLKPTSKVVLADHFAENIILKNSLMLQCKDHIGYESESYHGFSYYTGYLCKYYIFKLL